MAKELWYDKINRNVDWGGDDSTNNLPVAGSAVQDFIKTELNDKIGIIYHDEQSSQYLCFAHEDDKNLYLADPTRVDLIKSKLPAPSMYVAEIKLISNRYNALLLGETGNYLEFGYDIVNNNGQSRIDDITYEIILTRNANTNTINGSCIYGNTVRLNIDDYLTQAGTVTAKITIKGQLTNATIEDQVTYEVVNLSLTNNYDISQTYSDGEAATFLCEVSGSSNIADIEWFVDWLDEPIVERITGITVKPGTVRQDFPVKDLTTGVHSVRVRAYVDLNGDKFYTNTLYREFIVVRDDIDNVTIAFKTTIPSEYDVASIPTIYNAVQYEPCTITYAVYNKANLESVPIEIYVNNTLKQTVNAPNHNELTYTFTPDTFGIYKLKFVSGIDEREFVIDVSETTMDLSEITGSLTLNLSAIGRSNSDADKDAWNYGDYTTTFTGFTWSETSGWNNNRLVIGEGMSIETNIKPLYENIYGKTLEFELETINVVDDDAVICDVRNAQGLGLLITASGASLRVGTADDQIVSTKFKSNENIRITFVVNAETKMALIYINGVVSGAIKFTTAAFSVDKTLSFIGSGDANVQLKQIRIYDTKLSSDQILNNYILYRDTISEMRALYDRNDILDGSMFSIEKVAQNLPVMKITGDINYLESQKDTDAQTGVDVEYTNYQDPVRNFKMYGACLRIQGTSSAGYPKKNYRLYTKRKTYSAEVYDYLGNLVESQKLAFKEGAIPVNCWCLKADYAESSGTHNTGVATLWNHVMYNANDTTDGYVCRTEAQKAALENNYQYDVRTTVDGFPIAVFARQTNDDEYVFIGKYNFNNDKSTENVFGFRDIPGFDNSKMQCWEMTENGNNYALFKTTEGWDDYQTDTEGNIKYDDDKIPIKNWASGFEARYPDDGNEADTTDLKAFANWLINCDSETFYREKKDHLDLWKIAAYYVYLLRFGAVDQVVKNSMFTSEDGQHWYYINYDNDTILGLKNTGALVYPPTITRDTLDGATYAYAGRESRLWNMLEADAEFTRYVSNVDKLLYNAGLTYDEAIKYFNTNQSDKWCERIYNQDAEYKYIGPSTNVAESGLSVNTLFMMQGSRKAHRTWWLAKRFKLMDGKFNNNNYVNQNIQIKFQGLKGLYITVVAGDYMYYGCQSNQVDIQMGIELDKGESYTFYKPGPDEPNGKEFNVGDPVYVYAPYAIEELDLSKVSKNIEEITLTVKDPILGTRLKKLIMSSLNEKSQTVKTFAGLNNATNLEYFDIRGLQIGTLDLSEQQLLKTFLLKDSGLRSLTLPDGCAIETLQLNDVLDTLNLSNLPTLSFNLADYDESTTDAQGLIGFTNHHINNINIVNCPGLTNVFNVYHTWSQNAVQGDSLTLTGLYWENISPERVLQLKNIIDVGGTLNLKGKIKITHPTLEQVEALQDLFGKDCFTNNAELWISAPESVFIRGPLEIRSGDSQEYSATVFSENPGVVTWSIEGDSNWVKELVGNNNTCTLTTIEDELEDHTIVLKAFHQPPGDIDGKAVAYEIVSKKTEYSTSGTIVGNTTVKKDTDFQLTLNTDDYLYHGDHTTKWSLTLLDGEVNIGTDVTLSNETNRSVTVKYINEVIFAKCELSATITNKNGTEHVVTAIITVTDESVLMTSTSNPEVIAICHSAGMCTSPDVMYRAEANKVMDIGNIFQGGRDDDNKIRPGSNIKTFDELEAFTSLTSIPDKAFFQCYNLTSVKLPAGLQKIGSFSFGATNLSTIEIPQSVTDIYYTAFDGTPLKEFTISSGNASQFAAISGVLMKQGSDSKYTLIKYPEGKTDVDYTIPSSVVGLNTWSIKNTMLKTLTLSDNIISHSDRSIADNNSLTTLNLGKSIAPLNLAQHIVGNKQLTTINVSDDHTSLCSVNGIVYSIDKSTLWKYPEGRTTFEGIETSVKIINDYAVSECMKLTQSITIPDHIEKIGVYGFFACQYIPEVLFTSESKLTELDTKAFQLLAAMTHISLPASLKKIGDNTFGSCFKLGHIDIYTPDAPSIIATSFGSDSSSWSGKNAETRIVYTLTSATGFDGSSNWNTYVFNNRSVVDEDSGTSIDYSYTLSQTL